MKIKIVECNAKLIENELEKVNGKAVEHTFTTYKEIANLAAFAEKRFLSILKNKTNMQGARYVDVSGDTVAISYSYPRIATRVELLRGKEAWFLVDVKRERLWSDGGKNYFLLTKRQDEYAVKKLRENYSIAA